MRHIPSLRQNLISLSTLDTLGYDYSLRNESMKVGKDSLVIMKGKRRGNLYKLIGDPAQDGVATTMKNKINVSKKFSLKSWMSDENIGQEKRV